MSFSSGFCRWLLAGAWVAVAPGILAEEAYGPGYQPFASGNTILVCKHPSDQRITQDNFDRMFPALSTYIHSEWKAGIVTRAHFLDTIDEGIFLIVKDGNGEDSVANAERIRSELVGLFAKNDIPLKATCVTHKIGPLWLDDLKD